MEPLSPLSDIEVRALGSLVEKHLTTPQYYPLTMNALVNACNQTSNRSPVMHVEEPLVHEAVKSLRDKGLARNVHATGDRVTKYKHIVDEAFELDTADVALLGVLLLRGAQTPGELRGRTERMAEFASVDEVEAALERLASRAVPLVTRLERRPGQKEARYAHLLAGEPAEREDFVGPATATGESATPRRDRISVIEEELAQLRDEVARLRDEMHHFFAGS